MSTPIDIGPFRLTAPLARGGFGQIWRAVHVATGADVAVKVMTEDAARERAYVEAFRAEVQAVARMDHPGVVRVFDFGTVPALAAQASGGALMTGSPYFVMELAPYGSVDARVAGLSWRGARTVLARSLRALAHAHARGVFHLDFKPGNILVCGQRAEPVQLKLSDFGLAHIVPGWAASATDSGEGDEFIVGTPGYIAPEQVERRRLDYGPWTDLYALGIMSWELVSGRLPFVANDPVAIVLCHLREPLPPLVPRWPVPDGLAGWIERLTRKRAEERFQCAADALYALEHLCAQALDDDVEELDLAAGSEEVSVRPTMRLRSAALGGAGALEDATAAPVVRWSFSADAPPPPATWRALPAFEPAPSLVGAGLGLYGLRPVPLVDRQPQRDLLWEALARVRRTRRAHVVLLAGGSGFGKSRLAEWLCTASVEHGAARVLATGHDPAGSFRQGLQSLVAQRFNLGALSPEQTIDRISAALSRVGSSEPYEARALAEIARSATSRLADGERTLVRFSSNAERFAVVARDLARVGRDRPLIVFFDDVHWGADSLSFVRHVLETPGASAMPVLFVLTAQNEALTDRPIERAHLERIAASPVASMCEVDAIPPGDFRALVEQLLMLDARLASEVILRADGNPLYADRLVGDWVHRGVLEPARGGFRLVKGARITLPDTLHDVWRRHAARVLQGRGQDELTALRLAAALGQSIAYDELDEVLARGAVARPDAVIAELAASGLVRLTEDGFVFGHSMFRDSLVRDAESPEWLHGVCADALTVRLGPTGSAVASERIARHLVAARRYEEALMPLVHAARAHIGVGAYAEAHAALDDWDDARRHATLSPDDARLADGALARAEAYRRQWTLEPARAAANEALALALAAGLYPQRAEALSILGNVARLDRDLPAAERLVFEALGIFELVDDFAGKARAHRAAAVVMREQGRLDMAVGAYERALNLFWTLSDEGEVADCLYGLGHVYRTRQAFDRAALYYEEARQIALRTGNRHQLAEYVNGLAEVARYQGRLDEAEAMYREAYEAMVRVGSRDAQIPKLNLALTLILRGRYGDARGALIETLADVDNPAFRVWGMVQLLTCHVGCDDLAAFDDVWRDARSALDETAMVDTDIAESAELCARLLGERGEVARAADLWALAIEQWTRLGVGDRAATARRRRHRLSEN